MQSGIIPVRINIGCGLDICMAHQLFCHVDGDPCPLEISTEGVTETVWGKIIRDDGLHDFPILGFGAHLQVKLGSETVPHAAHAAFVLDGPGFCRENQRKRFPPGRQEAGEQGGMDWNITDAGGRLGPFNGAAPAFFGSVDVNFIMFKIYVRPRESCGLPRPHSGIQKCKDPKASAVSFRHGQDGSAFFLSDRPTTPLADGGQLQQFGGIV